MKLALKYILIYSLFVHGYGRTDLTLVELLFHLQQRDTDCPDACYLMILIVKPSDETSTTSIKEDVTLAKLLVILKENKKTVNK